MIRARQVSFRYPQDGRGSPPVSLEILPGEFALVTGPSGCGKSTLARCLMGLIPHLYHGELVGEVWLDGQRVARAPLWQLAEHAGMVFQNPASQMLAPSVAEEIVFGLENLGLPAAEIEHRVDASLAQFDLTGLRDRSPHSLSGGEQQRLALAAIMARQPRILILDEPLSMLDTTAAEDLITHLGGLAGAGKTVAMFEHRGEYLEGAPGVREIALTGASREQPPSPAGGGLPEREAFRLEVDDLHVVLGGRPVLRGMGLSLTSGSIVAVVGRNGVGKTTLLRALCGLQPCDGSIRVVTTRGDRSPDFGIVFQNPDLQLFNATVRDEMLYRVPQPDSQTYRWLLAALGLEAYEDTPPLLLSEGEKKRLALGLALMRRPLHGLLLDEPSLGQDSTHKGILMGLLRRLAGAGYLVIMTTHDLTLASQADSLVLLNADGVCAQGPTGQVLRDRAAWERSGLRLPAWFLQDHGGAAIA